MDFRFSGMVIFFLVYYLWLLRSYIVSHTGALGGAFDTSPIFLCVSFGGYANRYIKRVACTGKPRHDSGADEPKLTDVFPLLHPMSRLFTG